MPDMRYVFGLILISLYLFFLLMFFLSRNLKMNDCIITYIAIERLVSLADASGVPVRTIRALEQRQRSFSKLNLEYAASLSKCLGIRAEDLLWFDQ